MAGKQDDFPTSALEYDVYAPEIGTGAFATVYRAKVKANDKEVAIKVVSLEELNSNLEDVRKEIMIMRQLQHPNVVKVHTAFVEDANLWIVMPLLLGGSCAAIIKRLYPEGFKDETLLATILKETLQGLQYFHKDALIHRDIKAGNILIGDNGEVQLADFGVAGNLIEDGNKKQNRRTFTGTPCWMAPEVMEQTNGYGPLADIWSFGITAMELAFGSAPYAKYQPMKVLLMTLQEPPPTFDIYGSKSKFSDSFKKMVASCLVKDPKKRPTAKELLTKSFFKKAANFAYVKENLLKTLPVIAPGTLKIFGPEETLNTSKDQPVSVESWVFDSDDLAAVRRGEEVDLQPLNRPSAIVEDVNAGGSAASNNTVKVGRFTVENQEDQDKGPEEPKEAVADTLESNTVVVGRFTVADAK